MKFGSVCSGIEAASVAWHPLGWKAAWLSEIEPFPSAILKHHYPDVPNLGDMTLLPERILSGEVEAPDVFCGGTPCQAFSVAGLRNSLDDARGNLSLTFVGIANAIDHVRSVRREPAGVIFWENVPGVLSTKDNAFGCFLAGLAGENNPLEPAGGKWTNAGYVLGPKRAVAWRLLDAQYFGVAQRRKRVFVVASARNDFDPAAVLFEFNGVRRDIAPSRETGQNIAPCVTNGPPFSRTGNERVECEAIITMAHGQGAEIGFDRGPTLTCNHEAPIAAYQQPMPINTMVALRHEALGEGTGFGIGDAGDPAYTLTKGHSHAVAQPIGFNARQDPDHWSGRTGPLDTDGSTQAVAFGGDIARTLQARHDSSPCADRGMDVIASAMQVRRLTPVECERLQGFPDNYTNIPWSAAKEAARKGISYEAILAMRGMTLRGPNLEECPDGPRYKALGNSWAVPVVRWIGKRIQEQINAA
jgi:DNA (cytosine-5)-methyltransferase 1